MAGGACPTVYIFGLEVRMSYYGAFTIPSRRSRKRRQRICICLALKEERKED